MDGNIRDPCANSSKDAPISKPQCENGKSADIGDQNDGVFVNLTVPPGAEAGVDSLTFEYGGNELDVLIPPGSAAGDVLTIQVGVGGGDGDGSADDEYSRPSASSLMDELGGSNGDESTANDGKNSAGGLLSEMGGMHEESEVNAGQRKRHRRETKITSRNNTTSSVDGLTIVELDDCLINKDDPAKDQSKNSLKLVESIPGADGSEKKSSNGGDGTHGMVWSSGLFLAQAITSSFGLQLLKELFQGEKQSRCVKCLELGSGLGVGGLALARALASVCGSTSTQGRSARVLLSDLGGKVVELLKENIRRNLPPSGSKDQCVKIEAESLSWGNALASKQSSSGDKFDLILGSDLLYNTQQSYDPLIKTIKTHLHPEQGIILLAVRWRKPDLERDFFERAEKEGLKFDLWKELTEDGSFSERSPCTLSWREYGNPECEASNRYFHEVAISIANTEMPLAKIGEQDLEYMNDEEYATFEELQVQIYVGRYDKEMISKKRQRTSS